MKASILDLRRRMSDVLRALARGERVTILHRGKEKGVLYPANGPEDRSAAVSEHAAFGMWRDRGDLQDVDRAVRKMRRGRVNAV